MVAEPVSRARVVAVLGPTNTGKTHFAVERMLAYRSGMMGFPLRLLAREIYDRIVALRGPAAVALVTGEERVGRPDAPYVVATVEAMPIERPVEFLAVDEIQLCADPERGHIFTDRLLRARGLYETVFLGAETIRPILKRLVPEAEIVTRPRFSVLAYDGHRKLARLPRRSAIVAFSAAEVYALAEAVRRRKGGAAVVMGALSPRTRNAQVALYQSGEVDHLVATDAIGMGLNMDVAHVAFARLTKFDGREARRLHAHEVAQIAGRAGRHMANGSFGTTEGCEPMDERLIEAVESHAFPPLKTIRWRSAALDWSSIEALLASLEAPPPADCLVQVKDALDHRSLVLLARRPEIAAKADRPERVRLLWQVCQIPDFRKTLDDAHLRLLATVFEHLVTGRGLPTDWFASMVARLERTDGDIDTLVQRIAHVRTLTYLSHRSDWLADAAHFQERTRALEDRLSDALHERLTQRFVDRRTTLLLRSMRERGDLPAVVEEDGAVLVDGERVGRVEGLRFAPEPGRDELGRKLVQAATRRAVYGELARRARWLDEAVDTELSLDGEARLIWRGEPLARLVAGPDPLRPRVVPLVGDDHHPGLSARVGRRCAAWLERWLERRLGPLLALRAAAEGSELGGPARGVAWRLVEGLGSAAREPLESLLASLSEADRKALGRLGVRFGLAWLYLPPLLKAGAVEARTRLVALARASGLRAPPPGAVVLRGPALPSDPAVTAALGFAPLPGLALRQDVLERLAADLRARARASGAFASPADLAARAGLSRGELEACLPVLGFARIERDGEPLWVRARHGRPRPARELRTRPRPDSPFAALAALEVRA